MFKKLKIKKLIFLLLVFLLSLSNFAAVVSDNDGSAFITKGEFDSIKNDFQTQINNYNTSIDNKIDGAIAQYLDGIRISTIEVLPNASSLLEYPLNIWSTNKANFDISDWDNGTSGLWNPGWNLVFCYNRSTYQFYRTTANFSGSAKTNFLNLSLDSSTGHYKINTTYDISDVTINLTAWILFFGVNDTNWSVKQSIAVQLDTKTWPSLEAGPYTSAQPCNLLDNYEREICLDGLAKDAMPMKIGSDMIWNASGSIWTYTTNTYPHDYINGSSQWYRNGVPTGFIDTYSTSLVRENQNMRNIYNNSADSYVPVCFDGNIYITNNNYARKLLLDNSNLPTIAWDGSAKGLTAKASSYINKFVNSIVDPGYCLEPVDKGSTTRDKSKKCLWQPKDIYYNATLPQSKNVVEQKMTEGILLTELPSKNEVESVTVELDTSLFNDVTLDTSEDVYVVFSKNPIGDIDAATLSNCLDLYDSSSFNTTTKVKNRKLEKNVNTFYLKDMVKGDKLYYKVYYSNTVTKPVIINKEPTVTLVKES